MCISDSIYVTYEKMDEEETEDVREAEEFVAQEIIPSENSVSPPCLLYTSRCV